MHTALVAEGEEEAVVNTGVVYTAERVRADRTGPGYGLIVGLAQGKLDPSRTRKVINLTSYEQDSWL